MRQLRSRKSPRSGGIVSSSPSRCSSTEHAGAARVRALADLRELLRVAEQDEVAGAGGDGERVGERHLAGLVDQQDVDRRLHALAREQPRRAGDQQHVVGAAGSASVLDVLDVMQSPS